MAKKTDERRPEAKSKTGLRRGQFAPGIPNANKAVVPPDRRGTTRDEEAMLFGETSKGST